MGQTFCIEIQSSDAYRVKLYSFYIIFSPLLLLSFNRQVYKFTNNRAVFYKWTYNWQPDL